MPQFNPIKSTKFTVIYLAIPAGTLGNEPELIESRSSKDKLATAGFFGGGSKSKENDTYPATPQPPGSTVPPHPPATDENIMFGKIFCSFWSFTCSS